MEDSFITEKVCQLKHEEVEKLEKNVEKLFAKLDRFQMWMLVVLGGVIANLAVALFSRH